MSEKYKYTSLKAYSRGMEHRIKIVKFIYSYYKKHEFPPLQSEIARGVNVAAKQVNRYVWDLYDNGVLETIDVGSKQRIFIVSPEWLKENRDFIKESEDN